MNARVRRIGLRALGMMAVAAVTLSATYATVHAQQLVVRQRVGQPDQLPRGFVDLLLGRTGYSPGVPAYLVGAVGAVGVRLPGAEAFAAEGRVIGSVAWRDRSATAIAVARDVEGARERFETLAQEAGWTPRPAAPERRGFVPARSEDPIAASASPTIPVSRSALIAPDSSYVVLDYRPVRGGSLCRPPDPRARRDDHYMFEAPTLRPPDGLSVMGSGMSASSDEASSSAMLFGAVAPAELIAYFEPQVREQGWTLGDRMAGDDAAVITAEKQGEGGSTLQLKVVVRRVADEEQSLTMRITRRR